MKSLVNEKIKKNRNNFLHTFQNIVHILGQKEDLVIYVDILVNFLRIINTKWTISQKIKSHKNRKFVFFIDFRTVRIF